MWESCKGSVWESVKNCSRLCKETGNRGWILRLAGCQNVAHVPSMPKDEESRQLLHYRTKVPSWPSHLLAAWTRDSVKSQGQVAKPFCLGKTDISHSKHTPVSIPLIPTYCKELPRRILREKLLKKNKIDSSTIFIFWFSKFLYSHPLHCYIIERYINQIIFSPYPYLWEGYLVLGKQLRRDQLILVDTMSYSGIR